MYIRFRIDQQHTEISNLRKLVESIDSLKAENQTIKEISSTRF